MKKWIVVVNRTGNGIVVERVYGTKEQVKKYLLSLLEKDRKKFGEECWKFGTSSIDGEYGVTEYGGETLEAFACYKNNSVSDCQSDSNCEIIYNYSATPEILGVKVLN